MFQPPVPGLPPVRGRPGFDDVPRLLLPGVGFGGEGPSSPLGGVPALFFA